MIYHERNCVTNSELIEINSSIECNIKQIREQNNFQKICKEHLETGVDVENTNSFDVGRENLICINESNEVDENITKGSCNKPNLKNM